jgi:hypothetical protein
MNPRSRLNAMILFSGIWLANAVEIIWPVGGIAHSEKKQNRITGGDHPNARANNARALPRTPPAPQT